MAKRILVVDDDENILNLEKAILEQKGFHVTRAAGGAEALRRAVIMGSTLASFCVEAFSLDRLLELTRPEIDARYRVFEELTTFESL